MRVLLPILVLALALPTAAQESKKKCPKAQGTSSCCKSSKPWKGMTGGVTWEKSLEDAQKKAAAENKPILFYQLVGDLDKEGC